MFGPFIALLLHKVRTHRAEDCASGLTFTQACPCRAAPAQSRWRAPHPNLNVKSTPHA